MNKMTKSLSLKPIIIPRNKSVMGRHQCKKHPKHRQSPGVCSLCLSEKLSKVSLATTTCRSYYYHSSTAAVSSSVSSTSYESSYASSTAASPPARHRRMVSDVYTNDANEEDGRLLLSKCKSMAHVENKLGRSLENKKKMKNNNGVSKVWANLLRFGRLSNDQKRVNVEENHRKTALVISQPFANSTTMVLAS